MSQYKSYMRPNKGNINYFSNIDSFSKAYIVGFIAADGCLTKTSYAPTYTLSITIHRKDLKILEFIKNEIGCKHEIKSITTKMGFDPTRRVNHVRFAITDKVISQSLMNLGITPRKSLTMKNIIINIPKPYRKAFILGYFDGDGSVTHNKSLSSKFNKREQKIKYYPCKTISIQIRGTKEFLKSIPKELGIEVFQIRNDDNISSLIISKRLEVLKFFSCYENMPFYLERKYNKFKERI